MLERLGWVVDLGRRDYGEVYALQKALVQKRYAGEVPDLLLLVEHDPVITIGRGGKSEHVLVPQEILARQGIKVYPVDRGGDVTYHGPGQLVGYPILDLRDQGRDLYRLLRKYEEALIDVLRLFGLEARREPNYTGVWVGQAKVAAIGVGVKRWISFHGFALNVDPVLEHFSFIVPCGLRGAAVTSMRRLLGRPITCREVLPVLIQCFSRVFSLNLVPVEEKLLQQIVNA